MRWILAFAMTGSLGFFSMASAEEAVKFTMHRVGNYRSEACGVGDFNERRQARHRRRRVPLPRPRLEGRARSARSRARSTTRARATPGTS